MHSQSTCSSPGIVIHVASILRENPNRHHSPSRLRKAQFITHQSIRHPDINPPPSACCTQKRIVTSKKKKPYDNSISIQHPIKAFIQPDHQNRNWNEDR